MYTGYFVQNRGGERRNLKRLLLSRLVLTVHLLRLSSHRSYTIQWVHRCVDNRIRELRAVRPACPVNKSYPLPTTDTSSLYVVQSANNLSRGARNSGYLPSVPGSLNVNASFFWAMGYRANRRSVLEAYHGTAVMGPPTNKKHLKSWASLRTLLRHHPRTTLSITLSIAYYILVGYSVALTVEHDSSTQFS